MNARELISRAEIYEAIEEERGQTVNFDFPEPPEIAPKTGRLYGPYSPLEMKSDGLVSCLRSKTVEIESASVNSVALDHNPSVPISRMLVSTHVSVVAKKRIVRCMETTIMPAVPGLISLLSMIFAPKAELRVDSTRSRYTGVICGCGTAFSEGRDFVVHKKNDMEIVFDVDIDNDDIRQINIRHELSFILSGVANINLLQFRKGLRTCFLKLLKKPRKTSHDKVWPIEEFMWNRIPESDLCEVDLYHSHYH